MRPPRLKVWDRPVRLLHWALVAGMVAAWATSQRWTGWHEGVGYAVLAIVLCRVAWGFAGSRYARFTQFLRSPRATLAYAAQWRRQREPRHVGHNPLGGWMVVTLLGWVLCIAASGWLFTTDRFWGDDRVSTLHEWLAWSLLAPVALHLLGVLLASLRHRENLVRAMVDGFKRAPRGRDVA